MTDDLVPVSGDLYYGKHATSSRRLPTFFVVIGEYYVDDAQCGWQVFDAARGVRQVHEYWFLRADKKPYARVAR